MTIEVIELTPENLDFAMEMVTESFDHEVMAGARGDDYLDDWTEARKKLIQIIEGMPYVAMIAVEGKATVGLSVFRASPAYGAGWGVWDWFYVSTTAGGNRGLKVGLRLARASIAEAIDRGMEQVVSFVGTLNARLQHTMEKLGMEPVEIEMRGDVKSLRKGLVGHGPVQKQG